MNADCGTPIAAASLADAVFAELAEALARLAETGEETIVDLKSLPFSPTDLESLVERLGEGEVRCQLEVAGPSEVRETAYSGIWWVRHIGGDGSAAVEQVVVARVPEILISHPDDVAFAARRMAAAVATPKTETTTPENTTAADEEDLSRG